MPRKDSAQGNTISTTKVELREPSAYSLHTWTRPMGEQAQQQPVTDLCTAHTTSPLLLEGT